MKYNLEKTNCRGVHELRANDGKYVELGLPNTKTPFFISTTVFDNFMDDLSSSFVVALDGVSGTDLLLELELFILTFGAIGGGGNLL